MYQIFVAIYFHENFYLANSAKINCLQNYIGLQYQTEYMFSGSLFQDICNEWKDKPESEQEYQPFYRAVSAAAFSTGTRLKTRVQIMNQVQVFLWLI